MAKTTFSITLQSLRKDKKVTQEQLAEHLGVSAQAVSKWENGNYPDSDLLPKIADFFGVSIDYLYGRGGREKSIEQQVLEAIQKLGDMEDALGKTHTHNDFYLMIKRLLWTVQIAPWKGNKDYYDPPLLGSDNPKASAVFYDDNFYSYMGLSEDNDFHLVVNNPEGKRGFEKLFDDPETLSGFFKILSDKDALLVIRYLYSLSRGQYAGTGTISKALGIPKEKVESILVKLSETLGRNRGNKPFISVKILIDEKEETVYGVENVFGGLFMGLMMLAEEYIYTPNGFNMMIDQRGKSWLDKEKIKK